MRTLVFELWGEWGHFRKYYSTSSPLTYSFIPPTTVYGVIGAILGLEKTQNEYIKILREAETKVGVGICQPVKKTSLGLNLINTKGNVWVPKKRREGARTQIRTEFLRNAKFRLYISMKDNSLYQQLVESVQQHKTYYTLSLGLSELLANFAYVSEFEVKEKSSSGSPTGIHSVVPISWIRNQGLMFDTGKRYKKERIPVQMNEERIVSAYDECLFEAQGLDIRVDVERYWEGAGHRFIFLNEKVMCQ